jgi:hypothetical protein
MGRSILPAFRIEYRTNHLALGLERGDLFSPIDGKKVKTMIWDVKSRTNVVGKGKPNRENLRAWRDSFNKSFLAGGVNEHITKAIGSIPNVTYARIVRQSNNEVMAEFTAPAFEVA